eukprot:scaffold138671_cov22-Tisochrysis_lutea.AAC.2
MAVAASSQAEVVYGDVTFPISGPDDILKLVERTMPPHTKMAVFDAGRHTTPPRIEMVAQAGTPRWVSTPRW